MFGLPIFAPTTTRMLMTALVLITSALASGGFAQSPDQSNRDQTRLNPPLEIPEDELQFEQTPHVPSSPGEQHSILRSKKNQEAPKNAPDSPSAGSTDAAFQQTEALDEILTRIVRENMPHEFTDEKKWGTQKKKWRGIKFRRDSDDGRLETKRRYKMVNHGTWKKHSAHLIDPEKEFTVQLRDIKNLPTGATEFDLHFGAHLKIDGRQSKWVNGIQLYSLSLDGHAKLRMQVKCEMTTTMDFSNFPPDLVFSPTITEANIEVDEFRIDRISKAGGEIAQQITRQVRELLDEKIDEKEEKLVKKLNKQLNKKKDKLRLSVAQAIKSKWYDKAKPFLPDPVQSQLPSK